MSKSLKTRCAWWSSLIVCCTIILVAMFAVTDLRGPDRTLAKPIDIHYHYCPPFYSDYLTKYRSGDCGLSYTSFHVYSSLKWMNRHGIRKIILSLSAPGVVLDNADQETVRRMARAVNEYGAQIAAILGVDAENALYKLLNDRHSVVLIHPGHLPEGPFRTIDEFDKLNTMADLLLDTVRALNHILVERIPQRYPNIRCITAHGGGFWPYAADRFAYRIGLVLGVSPQKIIEHFGSFFYFDTAELAEPVSIHGLTRFTRTGHILFGTDLPMCEPALLDKCVSSWDYHPSSRTLRDSISFGAAESLLLHAKFNGTTSVTSS